MSADRFEHWPWRDFGHSAMTHRQATLEASFAEQMAEKFGLRGSSVQQHVSDWKPWAQCDAAEFAVAGVGVA